MAAKPFLWTSRIRFVDTDASLRIHYSALFRHFEIAEDEFLRALGIPYSALESPEISYPRVHVEADYIAPLVYDDVVEIEVNMERVGTSSMTFQFLLRKAGALAAKGRIVVVAMNRSTGKACPIPASIAGILKQSTSSIHA